MPGHDKTGHFCQTSNAGRHATLHAGAVTEHRTKDSGFERRILAKWLVLRVGGALVN